MAEAQITNPNGAFGVTDVKVKHHRTVDSFSNSSASVAIAEGDLVVFDQMESATGELTVHQADVSADDPALIAGVAAEAIPASGDGLVVIHGFALVNIGNGSTSEGERMGFHASTDGCADSAAADASTISGDTFGVALGAEIGTTNQCAVWID
jgi:hypothetical protein